MIKSWLITFLVLALLAIAYFLNIFEWIGSRSATITAAVMLIAALTAAVIILGNPFDKNGRP